MIKSNVNRTIAFFLIYFLWGIFQPILGQESLLNLLDDDSTKTTTYTEATFKGNRLLLAQSVETLGKNDAAFIISHHFGEITNGFYDLFGLDMANTRFGFDYGLNNRITLGIGRCNYQKLYDGYFKVKILRQSTGMINMPLSLSFTGSTCIMSQQWSNPTDDYNFEHRISYTASLILARKMNRSISLQIMPEMVHRNLVEAKSDLNTLFAMGMGGRVKLNPRISITAEYHYLIPMNLPDDYKSVFSLGIDIETGGHIFQLHFSNTKGMVEKTFLSETNGTWLEGNIYFGFAISRYFSFNTK